MKIRLLLDENTSEYALTNMLRKAGYDVVWLQQLAPYGTADEHVSELALKEKRVLYTRDRDFLRLSEQVKAHAGIILEYHFNRPTDMNNHQILKAITLIEKRFWSLKNQIVTLNNFRKH